MTQVEYQSEVKRNYQGKEDIGLVRWINLQVEDSGQTQIEQEKE
jgi:hypothetical protein